MSRRLLLVAVFALGLAVPALAFGSDSPSPDAAAACKAEYIAVGPTAFKAKYGNEAMGACLAAHGAPTTTTATVPTTTARTTPELPTGNDPASVCKREYLTLGAAAFAQRYGAKEPYAACVVAHGGSAGTTTTAPATTTTRTTPELPTGNDPASVCKREYLTLGATAFAQKYGAKEPYAACVVAHGGSATTTTATTITTPKPAPPTPTTTTTSTTPKPGDSAAGARSVAGLICTAEAKKLGKDAFTAKYGSKESYGICVNANLTAAAQIYASCKSSAGPSKDAFTSCVTAAAGSLRRR